MTLPLLTLLSVLFRMKLLTPVGVYRLLFVIFSYGINLMALLKLAASSHGDRIALTDDHETLTYKQLLAQSERLTVQLSERYGLAGRSKVGMLCRNHASLVKSIFAISMTGADIYLMNAEMSQDQFTQLLDDHSFDLLIYDAELTAFIEQSSYTGASVSSYHDRLPAISNLIYASTEGRLERKQQRTSTSKLMLLTGGTTGRAKKVAHKPSLFHYLPPFSSMLARLRLLHYSTVYIATPIYHGYGIAILLLFVALGKKSVITVGFHAEKACRLIREHHVEVVTVVPLMVDKMLRESAADLKSLACIASGGAELSPRLASDVYSKLGDVLFNLYGTSESGLNIIATPQDLKYSSSTIGQLIKGVRLKVLDSDMREVGAGVIGQLCIRRNRSMWLKTGDMGYRDVHGYYFLKGRVDDMVVSAGENVYPSELEHILSQHPLIEDAAVIGIPDEQFGQRLKAVVQLMPGVALTADALFEWLRGRAARYQMPKEIVFVEQLAYTPLGKRDKKNLC